MKRTILIIALLVFAGIAAIAAATWWFVDIPLVSPLSEGGVFKFITPDLQSTNKVVYGFLPYWNLDNTTLQPELTNLAYFSLTVAGDGTLVTKDGRNAEPGYNKLQSDTFLDLANQAKANHTAVELVITQMDNDDIRSLLSSSNNQDQLIASIDNALQAYPFTGINLDIEYTDNVTPEMQSNLSALVTKLRQHLNAKYKQHIQLSIDVYANSYNSENIWDMKVLGEQMDYVIVMAYDFHFRSSPQSGPVAPLFGGKKYWNSDINQDLQEFIKVIPSKKILLGIPFYGYEWQTTSADQQAPTYPNSGSTASFDRVQSLLQEKDALQLTESWNEDALSPYLTYSENNKIYTIYYENSRSISYKLDYVNQLDLGGVAIWALGYEGNSRELWDVIKLKLRANN